VGRILGKCVQTLYAYTFAKDPVKGTTMFSLLFHANAFCQLPVRSRNLEEVDVITKPHCFHLLHGRTLHKSRNNT